MVPPELLERSFAALPLRAYPATARVCRAWREASRGAFAPFLRWRAAVAGQRGDSVGGEALGPRGGGVAGRTGRPPGTRAAGGSRAGGQTGRRRGRQAGVEHGEAVLVERTSMS